ncbi:osmotically inducible protein C [Shewanella sp. NFH-SH190041]|uniref:bifunctional alpha/beta hydrolase/OsmC family protein n=1 Tax=Shewanella sp. NFH-SH190041 TaxID=2950245 RepID=UPI0021C2BB91|nr:bifunctional alpha/beta hydrolase/OsmC family protein [Shewanella sp. NFH-SH190041]BDM64871.1 osmotically inducible protein C [Shewanella sp. NFH-SH190041]
MQVSFPSGELMLSGLLEQPSSPPQGVALFAHCFTCGKSSVAASRISKALVEKGFAVLRFDFTGLGSSDGDFANSNFSSNVADLVAAADYLRKEYQAPSLLVGHSLGGRAVLSAAGQIPEVTAVVTIGAPADPDHVSKQFAADVAEIEQQGEAHVSLAGRPFTIKKQFLDDIRQENRDIEQLKAALLVMHSPVDNLVSIAQAEKIYQRAKHPKSFVSLDNANHLLTNKDDAIYVASVIAAWASRYLPLKQMAESTTPLVKPAAGQVAVYEYNHKFARTIVTDDQQWLADEPRKVGGDELGPDPYEMLLASLGACTSMTLRMYANRKGLDLQDVTVTLQHSRQHGEDCRDCDQADSRVEVLARKVRLIGNLTDAQRQRLLEIADLCPVHKTLSGRLNITTEPEDSAE